MAEGLPSLRARGADTQHGLPDIRAALEAFRDQRIEGRVVETFPPIRQRNGDDGRAGFRCRGRNAPGSGGGVGRSRGISEQPPSATALAAINSAGRKEEDFMSGTLTGKPLTFKERTFAL